MKKYLVFVLVSLVSINAFAQNIKYYEGAMRIPRDIMPLCQNDDVEEGNNGEYTHGKYAYYNNADGDRVWHGEFRIMSKKSSEKDIPVVITGRYNHGKKTGKWVISYEGNVDTDYNYRLEVEFKDDRLNGPYTRTIFDDKVKDVCSGTVIEGLIIGKVTEKQSGFFDMEIVGEVGKDGLPKGIWTVTQESNMGIVQRRLYRNGALVYVEETDNSTGERTLYYCAFEGQTRAPKASEIRDTIIDEYDCIVYNGHIARRAFDLGLDIDSRLEIDKINISDVAPGNIFVVQTSRWGDVYSEEAYVQGMSYVPVDIIFENVIELEPEPEQEYEPDYYFDEDGVKYVQLINDEDEDDDDEVFIFVDEQASFPGGDEDLMEYLNKNIHYPEEAAENGIEGVVVVKFVVEKDGSITCAQVLRDIGGGCGKEALRVVNAMPRWNPGKQIGRLVRSEFTLPIQFELRDKVPEK